MGLRTPSIGRSVRSGAGRAARGRDRLPVKCVLTVAVVLLLMGCSSSDLAGYLVGTNWQLLAIVPPDGGSVTPVPDPRVFTLTLRTDGVADLRIDCYRGSSRWWAASSLLDAKSRVSDMSGQLALAPIMPAPASCQKWSLAPRASVAISGPHAYLLDKECLFMDPWAQGDSLVWKSDGPVDGGNGAALSQCCSLAASLRTRC
ncbi:hypothetical protein DSM43276_03746 [Mycobacteroides salmoniphilum]|nr:hypothetical protein DSM43276_03746 [Mycobacteroides salmoniphilum]